MSKLTVRIEYDSDLENPCQEDGWKVYSFSTRHASFKHPEKLGFKDGRPGLGLRRKLETGTAFILSYFEHGSCAWGLKRNTDASGYPWSCPWDSVRVAGLLVWEGKLKDLGAKTLEARTKDAACFVESYTSWCNGEGYYFSIEDEDGEHIDSCGGFLGSASVEYMVKDHILPAIKGREYVVTGDAGGVFEDYRP